MKTLLKLALAFAVTLAASITGYAQAYTAYATAPGVYTGLSTNFALQSTYTTWIQADSTNLTALTDTSKYIDIPCNNYEELAVSVAFSGIGKATGPTSGSSGAVQFFFNRSVDGTNFETTYPLGLSVTASTNNTVRGGTNIYVGSFGYLRLAKTVNNNTNLIITNIVVNVGYKPFRTGTK